MKRLSRLLSIILVATALVIPPAVHAANGSYDQGVRFYQAKKFSDALVQFEAAYTMGYEPANCLYYAALCHQQLNDYEKAKQVYTEIVTRFGTTAAAGNARTALEGLKKMAPPPVSSKSATAGATMPVTKDGIVGEVIFGDSREGMIVPVIIQGRPVAAIWDTGATTNFFSKSQLEKAGIDTRKASKAGRAIGIGGEIETYRLDTLVVVGNVAMQMPVYFQDDTAEQRNTNRMKEEYGLLGEDFFSHFVYEVDPGLHRIRFLRPAKSEARYKRPTYRRGTGDEVPFSWEDGVMVVTPKINGRECDMIFDTGAASVAFSDKQLTAAGMTRPTDSRNAISYGVGGSRTAYAFSLNSVQLGPISRTGVVANVSVFGSQGKPLLGQSFLRGLRYTVDPERCVMRFVTDK